MAATGARGPRIVLFCVAPHAYRLARAWAEQRGTDSG